MNNRLFIFATYPAPYRLQLFEKIKEQFKIDVFFNTSSGDERNREWFEKGSFYTLDSKKGSKQYKEKTKQLKKYSLVAVYDYSSLKAVQLIMLCKVLRVPYVINCDGVMLGSKENVLKNWIKKILVKGADACLASGEYAKEYFLKHGAKEEAIYKHTFSALHEEDIQKKVSTKQDKYQFRIKLGLPVDCKIAIAVGRFIPLKRYNELIQAWTKMPKDYFLLLVGGGSEQKRYERTVKDLQLGNVIVEPFHPMHELFEYYKASDVFVHPTSYDVWGLVVNEAMACGLPAVVSDKCVAGLELVEQGINGFVVSMGDDAMMVDSIRYIFENEDVSKKMSKNCIKTIRPYTIDNMAKTHVEVFRELINKYGKNNSECRRFRP